MLLSSRLFVLLVVISFFVYYIISKKYKVIFLVILSYGFIASYSYSLLAYIVGYSLINYALGIAIHKLKQKKLIYLIGILFNLLQLAMLKYYNFLFNPLFNGVHLDLNLSFYTDIFVPLGISYFTLQGIGYLINIYKGWEKPENNIIHFLLYINYFPKFLSGPIERSNHFLPQLTGDFPFNRSCVSQGISIALVGYFKKVVIANQLGLIVNNIYGNIEIHSGYSLWIILLIQPFYLYFDFAGYTEIAIGLSKMFGLNLLSNFNRPFFSENISTFWRNWHMSLTNWFNDYVFRQVSFKYRRWGIYASVLAVFVTFTLFGIWHGTGWNFMILGFIQGIAINYEYFTKKQRIKLFSKIPDFFKIWISRLITFVFFSCSQILFFSYNKCSPLEFYDHLFRFQKNNLPNLFDNWNVLLAVFLIIIFLSIELLKNDYYNTFIKIERFWTHNRWFRLIMYYVMIFLVLRYLNNNEVFIYQMF